MAPDRSSARVVADAVSFPNYMALDFDGKYLYVARTPWPPMLFGSASGGESLGAHDHFTPPLGAKRSEEFGLEAAVLLADPELSRRWAFADGCALNDRENLRVTLVFTHRIVASPVPGAPMIHQR